MTKNISILGKLTLSFSIIVGVVVIFSFVAFRSLSQIRTADLGNEQAQQTITALNDLLDTLVESQNAMRGYVASTNRQFITRIDGYQSRVPPLLARLEGEVPRGQIDSDYQPLLAAINVFNAQMAGTIAAMSHPELIDRTRVEIANTARLTAIRLHIGNLVKAERETVLLRSAMAVRAHRTGTLTLFVGGGVTALIAIVMGVALLRSIASPVVRMTGAMNALAAGDTAIMVPGSDRRDEIGIMAGSVEVFRQGAIEKARLEEEARQTQRLQEQENLKRQAESELAARQVQEAMDLLAEGLARMAKGDLSVQISKEFAPQLEPLRADFNRSFVQLSRAFSSVSGSALGIGNSTEELATASDHLSRRTEQQAATLEETAAALIAITHRVQETTDETTTMHRIIDSSKADAEQAETVVTRAIEAMGRIDGSSRSIARIVQIISDLAFQTNILALNAGVEAARAGDTGRGFAVVAGEVRNLAHRSAEAVKEISALIATSSGQVEAGVSSVRETGEALQRLLGQFATTSTLVANIAQATRDQLTSIRQLDAARRSMETVTQQNAASAEQSAAASRHLATMAGGLKKLVGSFELAE
ncbi:HAMP domain-containing protein [Asaia spathodeae]|uniref:methyl-accepting chemotaxis protein n=1 Tax=Asaia spathodeae TaxID=657016 RepID=UPI002FC30E41